MSKTFRHLAATAAAATLGLAALTAQAADVVVDVAGATSVNGFGEDGNTVLLVDVGAHSRVTRFDWNVVLEAFAPSSLSELRVSFGNTSGLTLDWAPAADDAFSGTGSYSGTLDLAGLDLAVGADGQLRIEFSESFKDLSPGVAEGRWVSGQLSFGVSPVPEPASAALLLAGLGLVAGARRLRRR